jgi:hypothetical protein
MLSLIDVDKWWAFVDDLIRGWICMLCYDNNDLFCFQTMMWYHYTIYPFQQQFKSVARTAQNVA